MHGLIEKLKSGSQTRKFLRHFELQLKLAGKKQECSDPNELTRAKNGVHSATTGVNEDI